MKRILLTLAALSFLILPAVTLGAIKSPPPLDVLEVLDRIIDWLFTILLIFAAIMIVIAAYMFVTAGGNPEIVAKARHFVIYALIGVTVALTARGLVLLVERIVIGTVPR